MNRVAPIAMVGAIPHALSMRQVRDMTTAELKSHAPGSSLMASSLMKLAKAYSHEAAWMKRELEDRGV